MSAEMTRAADEAPSSAQRPFWTYRRRKLLAGYLWISPWWIGFLAFAVYPFVASLYYSFTRYNVASAPQWIGLENYIYALTSDPQFYPSILRTFYYTGVHIPLSLAASLLAAMILNQRLWGVNLLRTIYYLPALVPAVALAVMWIWLLNPRYGLINQWLAMIGIEGPRWLYSTTWAIPSLILMGTWGSFGGAQMLIFLAALQGVPQDLYEVADLDGANRWNKFLHVTVPMISPAILFNLIIGIIGSFQSFIFAYLVADPSTGGTVGGPNWATYFFGLHIYENAFTDFEFGYASALSWVMFLMILAVVLINVKLSGRWVFMAADGD
jgi:multiple sugar transport system permease protein